MSNSRDLSAEESKLLDLFYEKKDLLQLEDLEKLAYEEKGIPSNSIRDVLRKLVDNGSLNSLNAGSSVYYWVQSGEPKENIEEKLRDLETTQESAENPNQAEEDINKSGGGDCETEMNIIIDEISELENERDELLRKLEFCERNDPATVEKKRLRNQALKDAANRWTENIFRLKTWYTNKFGIDEETFNQKFQIPEDLDYLD